MGARESGRFGAVRALRCDAYMRWLPFVAVVAIVAIVAAACTPRAVTPPSRTFVMDSPSAPPVGGVDLQLDAASIGALFGPELVGGNARLRNTIEPGVTVEADGGVLHVTNDGSGSDRNAYTGRVGVLLTSDSKHAAFGAGVGGGTSAAAGSWATADVHGVISGAHRYVRPILAGGVGYSTPLGNRTFVVHEPDDGPEGVRLQLPRNLFAAIHVGLELGPPERAFVLGASLVRFWLREDSVLTPDLNDHDRDDAYLAFGAGLRLALD